MTQGELYWLRFGAEGSEPSGRRPAMVIQHDRFNRSAIQTTIVAAVTSNLKLAGVPGNVRLKKGEARELDYCTSYSHRGRSTRSESSRMQQMNYDKDLVVILAPTLSR